MTFLSEKSFELLQTERLLLRRPTKEDSNAIFSSYPTDPDVTKYLPFPPHKTFQDTLNFIKWSDELWEKQRGFNFILLSKDDGDEEGKVIGGIGISLEGLGDGNPTGVARIGYCIAKDECGKGYATEACKKMIELAIECGGITKLVAQCHPDNLASLRVLEKVGFQEDETASEMFVVPNPMNKGKVKLVGFARSLSLSSPPPTLTWEE